MVLTNTAVEGSATRRTPNYPKAGLTQARLKRGKGKRVAA